MKWYDKQQMTTSTLVKIQLSGAGGSTVKQEHSSFYSWVTVVLILNSFVGKFLPACNTSIHGCSIKRTHAHAVSHRQSITAIEQSVFYYFKYKI